MDEIKERLHTTSEQCLKAYQAWRADEKTPAARASLQEAVHELRKVASRLEIELAISERQQTTQKSLPVPPHRDSRARGAESFHDDDSNGNNGNNGNNSAPPEMRQKPARRHGPGRPPIRQGGGSEGF
ncbi:MAG: hypothetical protein K9G62_08540 [Alphaproteobacteria bacterium]|nr:hypothetical protein [Alphaproteobacteria bacterium]